MISSEVNTSFVSLFLSFQFRQFSQRSFHSHCSHLPRYRVPASSYLYAWECCGRRAPLNGCQEQSLGGKQLCRTTLRRGGWTVGIVPGGWVHFWLIEWLTECLVGCLGPWCLELGARMFEFLVLGWRPSNKIELGFTSLENPFSYHR